MKSLYHQLIRFSVQRKDDDIIIHSIEVSDALTKKNVFKWVTVVTSPIITMLTLALTIVEHLH
jgi:hypothetical protein